MPLVFAIRTTSVESYPQLAFCVRTSGSTGKPKTVLVPKSCIMPNVFSLSELLAVNENDVIFVCSPPTFDPFVVDVLMGMRAGACLLLVDNSVRLCAYKLLTILFPGVTIMQITPSMFTRWSKENMMNTIFEHQTTLRILLLGGEQFPTLHRPSECRTTVYNIYGITEVSCWSMIQKVSNRHHLDVPLGQLLDNSLVLHIRNAEDERKMAEKTSTGAIIGHLFVGSLSRKCTVIGETNEVPTNQPVFRSTGDLVELTPEGHYLFRGRCNRTIKRFGCRVSLTAIETVLINQQDVQQCAACVIGEQDRLVLFVKSDTTYEEHSFVRMLWKEMRAKLGPEHLPDELHRVDQLPLSLHGKVCNEGLTTLYNEIKSKFYGDNITVVEYLQAELKAMGILRHTDSCCGENETHKKLKTDASFIDQGGTSIAALRLHAAMEEKCGIRLPDLLTILIDPSVPLSRVLSYVEANGAKKNRNDINNSSLHTISSSNRLVIDKHYNLEKCIDSRPTISYCSTSGPILSVGSHSGMLLSINVDTNEILSRVLLPDRIECAVSFINNVTPQQPSALHGVVGCYDGFLYCFDPFNGNILWKYDAGGMIKCSPLVLQNETNTIIIGSYSPNHNLHCIVRVKSDTVVRWKLKLGTKPILAQPASIGEDEGTEFICVATLDGTLTLVSIADGRLIWTRTISRNVPIFSSPIILHEYNRIVCCGVDGTLGLWNAREGVELAKHQLPGNVFSSFETVKKPQDCIYLIVGCYDRNVHCIQYSPMKDDNLVPVWQIAVQSQVYATPLLIDSRQLVVCTTSGWLNLVYLDEARESNKSGRIVATMKMNGELFATPVVYKNSLYIGCRDNCLYKIFVHNT
uniref:Carrier domain-containing protein n=1 Tax=Anopheles farauti TaxID=69004 RepID=A0A182Q468_9DIPT